MGLCLLLVIVFVQTVCLEDGTWLGTKEGHEENIFIKSFLQETSFENRNKIVKRTKWRNVLRQIFRELQDSKRKISSNISREQIEKDKVEIDRKWFNRIK